MPKLNQPVTSIEDAVNSGADGISVLRSPVGYLVSYKGTLYMFRPESSIPTIVAQVAGEGILSPEREAEAKSCLVPLSPTDDAFNDPLFNTLMAAGLFQQALFMPFATIQEMNTMFKYDPSEDEEEESSVTLH